MMQGPIIGDDRPLAVDMFTGLHGWSEGLIAEGFRVIGFDIVDMSAECGLPKPDHFELVLQDVLTLHGSQFKDAALIVASPPCQFFSYCAMPWTKAKALAAAVRADPERLAKELALFNACFRIQREASEAAGRRIPLIVENVRGAIPWVGRSRWNAGSFHLWADVPALMPQLDPRKGFAGLKGFKDFHDCEAARKWSSKDPRRKAWSAMIAKIPLPLSRHIAATFHPARVQP